VTWEGREESEEDEEYGRERATFYVREVWNRKRELHIMMILL